jgi:hypothetical protein
MTLYEAGFMWISSHTNKNWNCHNTSGDSLQCQILKMSVQRFSR